MNRRHSYFRNGREIDASEAFDRDGCLRDGVSSRVSMQFRDARITDLQSASPPMPPTGLQSMTQAGALPVIGRAMFSPRSHCARGEGESLSTVRQRDWTGLGANQPAR